MANIYSETFNQNRSSNSVLPPVYHSKINPDKTTLFLNEQKNSYFKKNLINIHHRKNLYSTTKQSDSSWIESPLKKFATNKEQLNNIYLENMRMRGRILQA